jgi:hypothetical protein
MYVTSELQVTSVGLQRQLGKCRFIPKVTVTVTVTVYLFWQRILKEHDQDTWQPGYTVSVRSERFMRTTAA